MIFFYVCATIFPSINIGDIIMLFNSSEFLIFLPIVVLIYYVLPSKVRYIWLLAASYYFYMCWNASYALLLLTSTVITYLSGFVLNWAGSAFQSKRKCAGIQKTIMVVCILLNLGILFFYKYFDFACANIVWIGNLFGIQFKTPQFDVLLPVGISFYTFQAIGYTVDVYRGDTKVEKNFLRYALFVSFFPQLVAGPIERSGNLLKQLAQSVELQFDNLRDGLLLMLWGFFQKLVIADRIAVFVDTVYDGYIHYHGYYIVIATVLFAVQIYCDFGGYTKIAQGAAKMLGIDLIENFNAPYTSLTTAEFWRRWHISLSTWFRDYVYIPLGGNRKGKVRKYLNSMITFAVSGLWHGADWTYVIWGALNGAYQVIGAILRPIRERIVKVFGLKSNSLGYKAVQMLITFCCVDFAWIFFRAADLDSAVSIIRNMFAENNLWIFFDGSLYQCGLDVRNLWLLVICIVVLFVADCYKHRNRNLLQVITRQAYWCQAIIVSFAICFILVFGMWGGGYDEASFIYFQF